MEKYLIIDGNSVYEIDEECMQLKKGQCKKEKGEKKKEESAESKTPIK